MANEVAQLSTRNQMIIILLHVLSFPLISWGQASGPVKSQTSPVPLTSKSSTSSAAEGKSPQKAKIISDSALIYDRPDFDSTIIKEIPEGEVISVSHRKFGPFNRVRLSEGTTGFIADNDFMTAEAEAKKNKKDKRKKEKSQFDSSSDSDEGKEDLSDSEARAAESKKRKKRPFHMTRLRGPQLSWLKYREETMGDRVNEYMLMYGYRWTGPDLLMEGSMQTEWTLLGHYGAPQYYLEATGQDATGFLLLSDIQWVNVNAVSDRTLSFFSFGPMIRMNSYSVSLKNGSSTNSYTAQDFVIGAAFSVGIAQNFGSFALRSDFKYYWEKLQYWAIGLAAQFEF